ncbi:MAG: DUF2591 domain-containing protein [Pseudomonas sp.]|uniref:phage protein NinX family protein n=1 Tax=Pseudomonas sp. TaxID=306 RepID=UPI001A477595|nr:phage protein NinX family protein [Pseudomonas sp.]MBL7231423.1 DUF2591 domain-containing protein [Pseudomonas sp.]
MTEFVEVKTSELTGAALDWAVAKAEGMPALIYPTDPHYVYIDMPGRGCGPYMPSHAWFEGGPLIEKYKLDIGAPMENQNGPWNAATEWAHPLGYKGDTPLIAACRAIVASVLGDTVSVPKELLS